MPTCPTQSSPAVRAAVYTRISSDPSGQRAGVERQRADCEAHCLARGWKVAEVFCDNDTSAYGRKPRRAYERMMAAAESGGLDAIVTWHNDRLHRSPRELEAFIDLVERSRVRLAVVTGGDYDLTTPDGRLSARIVGAVASTATWAGALDRQTWDQVRAVLLNPERNTNVGKATRYLLTGLIHCGNCGAAMFSRPRDDHTKRYLCAGRRPGHQLGILAEPVDEVVKERVLGLLTTPSIREEILAQAGTDDDGSMGRTLAALGASQARLLGLDDDFYVSGALAEGRYRSIRVKLEREIDRLHALADAATKQRIVLQPDPRAFWAEADLHQRRDLVRTMVERIRVMPGRPAVRHFDPSRVQIDIAPWGRGAVPSARTLVPASSATSRTTSPAIDR